jgi:hypothetical protein
VHHWHVAVVSGNHQGHVYLTQVVSFFFIVSSSSNSIFLVVADVGEKIGGIEQEAVKLDVELGNHFLAEELFDPANVHLVQVIHLVPDVLWCQGIGHVRELPGKCRFIEPFLDPGLGIQGNCTVNRQYCEVISNRKPLFSLVDASIDDVDQVNVLANGIQSGYQAKLKILFLWGCFREPSFDKWKICFQVIFSAQINFPNPFRHTINAFGMSKINVGVGTIFSFDVFFICIHDDYNFAPR